MRYGAVFLLAALPAVACAAPGELQQATGAAGGAGGGPHGLASWEGCPPAARSQRIADGIISDVTVDVDGDHIAWLGDGQVLRARGKEEITTLATFEGRGLKIAAADEGIYWAFSADHTKHQPSLLRVTRDSKAEQTIVDGKNAGGAAVQAFVLGRGEVIFASFDGTIRALPREGEGPDRMYWSNPAHGNFPFWPGGIALAGSALYFTSIPLPGEEGSERLYGVDLYRGLTLGGGRREEISIPGALAGDERYLYMAHHGGGGRVRRVAHDHQDPEFFTLIDGVDARSLFVHGKHLYWSDGQSVGRVPTEGGPVEKLACGVDLGGVTAGGGYVYWVEGGRRIWRAALPEGPSPPPSSEQGPEATPPGPTAPAQLKVRALIDGVTHLFLQGDKIWWRVVRGAQPGWAGQKIKPCQIDGEPWTPDYFQHDKDMFGFTLSSCNCNSNPRVVPSPLAGPSQVASVEAAGRGVVFVAQQPSPENEGILVVSIDDTIEDGPDWYDLTISYATPAASP